MKSIIETLAKLISRCAGDGVEDNFPPEIIF